LKLPDIALPLLPGRVDVIEERADALRELRPRQPLVGRRAGQRTGQDRGLAAGGRKLDGTLVERAAKDRVALVGEQPLDRERRLAGLRRGSRPLTAASLPA
jgi:hypothetical protein